MITVTNECNMQLMGRYPDGYFDIGIVVACEKSPVHYNDAMKRYAQYKAQTKLF